MLVDTNILIEFLQGSLQAKKFIETEKDLSVSVLTVMEVAAGLPKKNQIKIFENFLRQGQIQVLPISEPISSKAYSIFTQYHHQVDLGIADSLIAATAIICNKKLLTLNTKHFLKIADLAISKPY